MKYLFSILFLLVQGIFVSAQTPTLLKDIKPTASPYYAVGYSTFINTAGGNLYLNTPNSYDGDEIWKTDGTGPGTFMLKSLNADENSGVNVYNFTALGSTTLFYSDGPEPSIWKTDGTTAGTSFVKKLSTGSTVSLGAFSTGSAVVFFVKNGNDIECWKTDGTSAGTTLFKVITTSGSSTYRFRGVQFGNKYIFAGQTATSGEEPWVCDGTAAGTFQLKDIYPGLTSSVSWTGGNISGYDKRCNFVVYNGKVCFIARNAASFQIWKTDGTTAGTSILVNYTGTNITIDDFSSRLAVANNYLYFFADETNYGIELHYTDGTVANTFTLNLVSGSGGADVPNVEERILASNSTTVFFSYDTWSNLGACNATTAVDLGIPPPNYGDPWVSLGGYMYADMNNGTGLLKTNGTLAGTSILNAGGVLKHAEYLTLVGSTMYFYGYTLGISGLWKSDGTAAGTVALPAVNLAMTPGGLGSDPDNFVQVGSTMFFTADNGTAGTELWKTDGTTGGTTLVKDISPGSSSSYISQMMNWNNVLYFSASDGTNGEELWRSDGTTNGTYMVKDIYSGSSSSSPMQFVPFNGVLYFVASVGTSGYELMKTDGTSGGTVMVKDINPSGSSLYGSYSGILGIYNNHLLLAADDNVHGSELWISDGTAGGTTLVKDIYTGANSAFISTGSVYNGLFYFVATEGTNGRELWVTDGTSGGTQLVKDINTGSSSSAPYGFLQMNGKLIFVADNNTYGRELWVTDGSSNGTQLLKDVKSGTSGSYPAYFTPNGSYCFFFANYGAELWKTDGTTAGTTLIGTICSNGCNSYIPMPLIWNGQLYFISDHDLYSSDGTSLTMVSGMNLCTPFHAYPTALAKTTQGLLVALDDQSNGNEIWKYNGTTGTLLGNINPNAQSSFVYDFHPFGNIALFAAYNSFTGRELYKMDNVTITGVEESVTHTATNTGFFDLYPVPTVDVLHIHVHETKDKITTVRIFDLQGRIVLEQQYNQLTDQLSVPVQNLASGVYVVQCVNADGSTGSARFVRQ